MHLISDPAVLVTAERVVDTIIETYLGPNRTLHELVAYAHQAGLSVMAEFSEACRKDLATRATTIR